MNSLLNAIKHKSTLSVTVFSFKKTGNKIKM